VVVPINSRGGDPMSVLDISMLGGFVLLVVLIAVRLKQR
jgi:hypothetical protein